MADVAVFLSYSHDDNEATYNRVIQIGNDARRLYKSLSGLEVGLFIDTEAINLGERWRERIRSGLTNATILLAFVSPLYLGSAACREEFQSFVSAALDADSRKLIIPLLFTPKANIEERFQNDVLWAQVVELQYLEVHDLRKTDPGSAQWMDKVEEIADRMRNVLSVPDLSVPPPTSPIEVQEPETSESGTFVQLRDFEQALQPFNQTILDLGEILSEYNGRIVAATPSMAAATSFSAKLAAANALADEITPSADRYSDRVQDFQKYLAIIDPGIRALFRMYRNYPSNLENQDAREFIESTKTLAETSLAGIDSMLEFNQSIEGSKGFSSKLDKPLQRMQSSILIMAGNRGIFTDWLAETEELGSND
jgi:hypothetical protein